MRVLRAGGDKGRRSSLGGSEMRVAKCCLRCKAERQLGKEESKRRRRKKKPLETNRRRPRRRKPMALSPRACSSREAIRPLCVPGGDPDGGAAGGRGGGLARDCLELGERGGGVAPRGGSRRKVSSKELGDGSKREKAERRARQREARGARREREKNSFSSSLPPDPRAVSLLTNAARGQAARGGESEGHLGRVERGAEGGSAGGKEV